MRRILSPVNLGLLIIFIVLATSIIVLSFQDMDGYLTSDSGHYLQLAENILAGNGLTTPNFVAGMDTYFATWPVGYPVLIALVAFITGMSVFWASKVVNILCVLLALVLIKLLFQERALIGGMIFFVSTCATIIVYSWSEVPFLLGLLWLVYGMEKYMERRTFVYVIHMVLAATFLFLMRYIGAIGGGLIGLLGFYYLFRREWKAMLTCWAAGTVALIFVGGYLFINLLQTGLATGMERIPRIESAGVFFHMLWEALLAEVNVFSVDMPARLLGMLVVVLIAVLLFIRRKHVCALFDLDSHERRLPLLFLLVGGVYFIGIVYMRWTAYFDTFNYRLLGPATFMIWLAAFSWVAHTTRRAWIGWQGAFMVILLAAGVANVGWPMYDAWQEKAPDYQATVEEVQAAYQSIPPDSIIAFEDFHARYLRLDLQYVKVHFRPYFADAESVAHFLERVEPNQADGIYLQYKSLDYLQAYDFDDSFIQLMEEADEKNEEFIELE